MELKIKSAPKAEWETIQVDGIYDIEEIIHIYKEKTGAQPRFKY